MASAAELKAVKSASQKLEEELLHQAAEHKAEVRGEGMSGGNEGEWDDRGHKAEVTKRCQGGSGLVLTLLMILQAASLKEALAKQEEALEAMEAQLRQKEQRNQAQLARQKAKMEGDVEDGLWPQSQPALAQSNPNPERCSKLVLRCNMLSARQAYPLN